MTPSKNQVISWKLNHTKNVGLNIWMKSNTNEPTAPTTGPTGGGRRAPIPVKTENPPSILSKMYLLFSLATLSFNISTT